MLWPWTMTSEDKNWREMCAAEMESYLSIKTTHTVHQHLRLFTYCLEIGMVLSYRFSWFSLPVLSQNKHVYTLSVHCDQRTVMTILIFVMKTTTWLREQHSQNKNILTCRTKRQLVEDVDPVGWFLIIWLSAYTHIYILSTYCGFQNILKYLLFLYELSNKQLCFFKWLTW